MKINPIARTIISASRFQLSDPPEGSRASQILEDKTNKETERQEKAKEKNKPEKEERTPGPKKGS